MPIIADQVPSADEIMDMKGQMLKNQCQLFFNATRIGYNGGL